MARIKIFQYRKNKFMFIDNELWMWDTQQEEELQKELAKQAFGDVLVAGYGFGIAAKFLLKNKRVKSVTTVELHKKVIDEMKKFGKINGRILIGNFYDLPQNKKYDSIIGDIWPDIDRKFLKDYVKFKKKAKNLLKPNGKILVWGGDYFEYLLNKRKKNERRRKRKTK